MRSLAFLLLSSCSILLDPAKVPALTCPAQPTSCSVRANATARCEGAACAWTCETGFADVDQDLALQASTGCEVQCSMTSAPPNPIDITATVGATPGTALLEWTNPGVASKTFRLCNGAAAGFETQCTDLLAADVCIAGACKTTLTNFPNGVRVFVRLQSVDACGTEGSKSTAPTVAFAPIDAVAGTGWVMETTCGATATWNAGTVGIEQQGFFCTSTLLAGTASWGDFTLQTDIRFSSVSTQSAYAGLVLRNGTQGHRVLLLLSPTVNGGDETMRITRRAAAGADPSVAESITRVASNEWIPLKVVSRQRIVSVSLNGVEVLRWPDTATTPTLEGSLGFALSSSGRAEFRNFGITTRATLPDAGPTSARYDFSNGLPDGGFPEDVRVRVPDFATLENCPAYGIASNCGADAGCLPSPASRCAHLRTNLFIPAAVAVDVPVGIDTQKSWRLGFNFAATPTDGGASYPVMVRGVNGGLLSVQGNYDANLHGLGQDFGRKLVPGTWNRAELRFDSVAGRFEVTINGVPVTLANSAFPPANWDPHLGAFFFGKSSLGYDGWVTQIELRQP